MRQPLPFVYIDKDHWPTNNSDLNPFDYCIWNEIEQVLRCNTAKFKKTLIVALKRAVKEIPKDVVFESCLSCTNRLYRSSKTKEIIFDSKIQLFCRELNDKFFRMKIKSKDWKLTEIIEK